MLEDSEFTVTLYSKGSTNDLTVDTAPAAVVISTTLENGVQDVTATASYNKCIITNVSYPNTDASGDRKGTYDVTVRPDGSVAAQGNT